MASPRTAVAVLVAIYLLWLATWVVFGATVFGEARHYWSQAVAAAATALVAFAGARRTPAPYPTFLALQGIAFALLAWAWVSYPNSGAGCRSLLAGGARLDDATCELVANAIYGLSTFGLLCAWGALGLGLWRGRPLSSFTALVFAVLMIGLGAILASFYVPRFAGTLGTAVGRLNAVTAAIEFVVLVAGLFCLLLHVRPAVVWLLVGTATLVAGDMAYSVEGQATSSIVPPAIDAVWMAGQLLVLAALVALPSSIAAAAGRVPAGDSPPECAGARSPLSGILILVSLGGALLSPVVWLLAVESVWRSFAAVLLIIALVMLLVWLTDRFDDTVVYLRDYVRRAHGSRLVAPDWRDAGPRIRAALRSTGLGAFADGFRESAAGLKRDVLFLGPERLFGPPRERVAGASRAPTCFIVMPFGPAWAGDVHRIIAGACDAAGVRAVRGDDLFTPTDILEDIWQSLLAADFVVADITGRNPNVLYELGIAHTLAKPVLIISRVAGDIPIDLATRRVLLYGDAAGDWMDDLAAKIGAAVRGIVADLGLGAPADAPRADLPA